MTTQEFLRFPSGRTVKRVKQDIRSKKITHDDAARANGIALPWAMSLDYLKDKNALEIGETAQGGVEYTKLIPSAERTSLLLGTPGSLVSQTVARSLMTASKLIKNGALAYVDFSVDKIGGTISPIFMPRHKLGTPHGVNADEFGKSLKLVNDNLDSYRDQWRKIISFVKESCVSPFQFEKIARRVKVKNSAAPLVVFAADPRKIGFIDLLKLPKNRQLVIADNSVDSFVTFISRSHLGLAPGDKSDAYKRQVLGTLESVHEQRSAKVAGKNVIFARSVKLTEDERIGLLSREVPILPIAAQISSRFESWESVTAKSVAGMEIGLEDLSSISRKAKSWDSTTSKQARLLKRASARQEMHDDGVLLESQKLTLSEA